MKTRRVVESLLVCALALLFAGAPAPAQEASAEETIAYQAWFMASSAKDVAKATQAAQDYLKQFPKGQYADYLKKWLAGEKGKALNAAIAAKKTGEVVAIGKELLAQDADNLNILYTVAFQIRRNELLASPAVYTHAADARDFATRSIKLIEAGQKLAGVDPAKWKKGDALGWLYQMLAMVEAHQGKLDAALAAYAKSSALDPDNLALNVQNAYNCGGLRKDRYDAAVKEFQALPKPEGGEPSPQMKAALDKANAEADAAIECWSRFVGLARANNLTPGARQQVEPVLASLWGYRHADDKDGLEALIARHSKLPAQP